MTIVCGKCGSRNIYGHRGVVPGDGLTPSSLSCLKCGNTSESNKYGFKEEDIAMGKHSDIGICVNCGQERLVIRTMNLCYPCQRYAQGKKGDARKEALAEIREKILRGEVVRGRPAQSGKVEGKPKIKPQSGEDAPLGGPSGRREVEESHITIQFSTEADQKLLAAIEAVARSYRRTTDQQILWLCQNEIKIHEELLKEKGDDHGI